MKCICLLGYIPSLPLVLLEWAIKQIKNYMKVPWHVYSCIPLLQKPLFQETSKKTPALSSTEESHQAVTSPFQKKYCRSAVPNRPSQTGQNPGPRKKVRPQRLDGLMIAKLVESKMSGYNLYLRISKPTPFTRINTNKKM